MKKRLFLKFLIICIMMMNISCNTNNRNNDFVGDKVKMLSTCYGSDYLLILNEDGTVYDTFEGNLLSMRRVNGLPQITYIAVGITEALAIDTNGLVWAWEFTQEFEDGIGLKDNITPYIVQDLDNVKMVSAGGMHFAALKKDGSIWLWGGNDYGQIGDGTYIYREKPVKIQEIDNIVKIECGSQHTIALRADGTVYEWGRRIVGENLEEEGINHPAIVNGIPKIKDIEEGYSHSVALGEDSLVYTWGNNYDLQLGRGFHDTRGPLKVEGITSIKEISAGGTYSLALSQNGRVWWWGENIEYFFGEGCATPQKISKLRNIKYISSAYDFYIAVKKDNTFEVISRHKKNREFYSRSVSMIAILLSPLILILIIAFIMMYISHKLMDRKKN